MLFLYNVNMDGTKDRPLWQPTSDNKMASQSNISINRLIFINIKS